MHDSEDYDFSPSVNSNLSSIFSNGPSSASGNSSLTYKAPRQPTMCGIKDTSTPPAPKSYYKLINLYLMEKTERHLGKYIVGLINTDTNGMEMLIYQNKKKILIRGLISSYSISVCDTKDISLNLLANDQKWILEFFNRGDSEEFHMEFSKRGGIIIERTSNASYLPTKEPLEDKQIPVLHKSSLMSNLNDLQSLSTILDPVDTTDASIKESVSPVECVESKKEKEDILARLAKMGFPRIPSCQMESEITEGLIKDAEEPAKNKTGILLVKGESNCTEEEQSKYENNWQVAKVPSDINSKTQDFDHLQVMNANRQVDTIALMLNQNQIINSELRNNVSFLTSKISEISSSKIEPGDKIQNQLKSKLRAFQMKSENLEAELATLKKKYEDLRKEKKDSERSCNVKKENSSQTENVVSKSNMENIDYKLCVKELLNFIECLPAKSVKLDLGQLNEIKENVKDKELYQIFQSSIHSIQKNIVTPNSDISNARGDFLKETKKIMIDFYSNVGSSVDENSEIRTTLAEQIRNMTLELVKIYDKSVENIL